MTDDNRLHQQLNRPRVPGDLENKIRANWLEQKTSRRNKRPAKYLLVAASIIAIVTGTALLNNILTSPDLISVAINDIRADEKQKVGITFSVDSLIQQAHINLPPESMPIKMTKLCNLNGNKTVHVKIAGTRQGEVHLFIRRGDFDAPIRKSEKNETAVMPWKLIKPRQDLSVLVLYTKDMNPVSVDTLLQTMFFA